MPHTWSFSNTSSQRQTPLHALKSKSPPSFPEIKQISYARNKPNVNLISSANEIPVLLPGSISWQANELDRKYVDTFINMFRRNFWDEREKDDTFLMQIHLFVKKRNILIKINRYMYFVSVSDMNSDAFSMIGCVCPLRPVTSTCSSDVMTSIFVSRGFKVCQYFESGRTRKLSCSRQSRRFFLFHDSKPFLIMIHKRLDLIHKSRYKVIIENIKRKIS